MKKRILLPTDFSKNAWNAIKYASELYKTESVDFFVLNAFKIRSYDIESVFGAKPGDKEYDEALEQSEKNLHKVLKMIEIKTSYRSHRYFSISIFDTPVEAIKAAVELKDIDLVVMGTKGATDANSVIYGSNAIDVMEKVRNCPVLAIPNTVKYTEPKEIVFPTSFKTHFKRRELNYLYEIAKITNSTVSILHINTEKQLTELQKKNKDLLEEFLDGIEYSFKWLDNVSVNNGLEEFVRRRDSDIIVFINKKHTFFDSIFSRPLVKDLGANSQIPILVLHDLRN
jgi:nucleotide-binding universal stress UspA family protein